MKEKATSLNAVLAWVLVAVSLPLNGFLLYLGYSNIMTQLTEIKAVTSRVTAIEERVHNQGELLKSHEAKLNELSANKQDKPGL